MGQQDLAQFLYEHEYTDAEKKEADYLVGILYREGFSEIVSGNPLRKDENRQFPYYAEGDGILGIIAIANQDNNFDYYTIDLGEKNTFHINCFQDLWLPQFDAQANLVYGVSAIPQEAFLFYVLSFKLESNKDRLQYTLYNRHCLKTIFDETKQRYRLEQIHGYEPDSDFAQAKFKLRVPVFTPVKCPSCGSVWMYDDSKIPDGEKYEIICPKCETSILRKK